MRTLLLEVSVPAHVSGHAPDHGAIGGKLDALLVRYFLDREVVIRCIGSQDHPNLSLDDLTTIILNTGTDKYDATRAGVGYLVFAKKGIKVDFYGVDTRITQSMNFMPRQIWEMYHSAISDRGFGVHVDLVLVYDRSKLDMVIGLYDKHTVSDGFVFKDTLHKRNALLGVIKILG